MTHWEIDDDLYKDKIKYEIKLSIRGKSWLQMPPQVYCSHRYKFSHRITFQSEKQMESFESLSVSMELTDWKGNELEGESWKPHRTSRIIVLQKNGNEFEGFLGVWFQVSSHMKRNLTKLFQITFSYRDEKGRTLFSIRSPAFSIRSRKRNNAEPEKLFSKCMNKVVTLQEQLDSDEMMKVKEEIQNLFFKS